MRKEIDIFLIFLKCDYAYFHLFISILYSVQMRKKQENGNTLKYVLKFITKFVLLKESVKIKKQLALFSTYCSELFYTYFTF